MDLTGTCPASANDFICDNVGIYPNPSDCTSFYKCSYDTTGLLLVAELKTCFTGYVFNGLVSGFCTPRIGNLNCLTLTCPTTGGTQFVRFGNTLRYYALCSPLLPAPLVKACPVGSIFKPSANRECEFICPGFGNFPHSEDTQKYFTCIVIPGVGLRGDEKSCGPREIYNVSTRRCIRRPTK